MRHFAITGMDTVAMISRIFFGEAMRATPPSARICAGTRSSAITATAPAFSAMEACSALVTSIITPPFSISARPVFRRRLVLLPLFCDMVGSFLGQLSAVSYQLSAILCLFYSALGIRGNPRGLAEGEEGRPLADSARSSEATAFTLVSAKVCLAIKSSAREEELHGTHPISTWVSSVSGIWISQRTDAQSAAR